MPDDIVNGNHLPIRCLLSIQKKKKKKTLPLSRNFPTAREKDDGNPEIRDRGDGNEGRERRQRPSSGFDGQAAPTSRKF